MNHLPILPILVPAFVGFLMLAPGLVNRLIWQRYLALITCVAVMLMTWALFEDIQSHALVYVLGGWQPPYGIMLLADHLSVLLILLTAFLAFCACLYASADAESRGRFFYPLFMFQIMGVNGAFLTGDIFNLFVFFEVLLIASYALLIHGGGKEKTRAGVQYVVLNLIGSAFFLIALGIIYGMLGSLNIADLSYRVTQLQPQEQAIVKTGAFFLLLVFGLKAAMIPLQFWLPKTYSSASAPVAAMFAIMTKVGVYSIYRIYGSIFSENAGDLANLIIPWLWPISLLTIVFAMIGVLAAQNLRQLISYCVIQSVGVLLLAFILAEGRALAAGLYYLIHSTVITAAFFLIADQVKFQRGHAQDRFVSARPMNQSGLIGALFFIAAISMIGLPPLSGFIGKVGLLQYVNDGMQQFWVYSAVLVGSLFVLIALSRAGTFIFYFESGSKPGNEKAHPAQIAAIGLLLVVSPMMTLLAEPIMSITARAGTDIQQSNAFVLEYIKVHADMEATLDGKE